MRICFAYKIKETSLNNSNFTSSFEKIITLIYILYHLDNEQFMYQHLFLYLKKHLCWCELLGYDSVNLKVQLSTLPLQTYNNNT